MKTTLTILLSVVALWLQAQNLVPNPSFESYGTLPCSWITSSAGFNAAMNNWTMPTGGSSDVFSMLVATSCFGHCLSTSSQAVGQQLPRTGDIMSAVLTYGNGCSGTNYREYLEVQLTTPLVVGQTYYAEMYVSHTDYSKDASNNIGMYFSVNYISSGTCTQMNYTPQINETSIITDNINWVKISGTFTATTAAQYLTIGNFYDNASTAITHDPSRSAINARYYVDDVLVQLVTNCMIVSADTTVCQGDAATLQATMSGGTFIGWADATLPGTILSSNTTYNVTPQITTTYLAYSDCDTLQVTVDVIPQATIDLGNDTLLCPGDNLLLDATTPNSTYLWQDNSTAATYNVLQAGTYWVQVTDNCGVVADTIDVTYGTSLVVDLGNDTVLCPGQTLALDATTPNVTYLWQDNSTSATYTVSQSGTYWVRLTDNCGSVADTITVTYPTPLSVDLGNDTSICSGQSVLLDATAPNATYLWQDNSINPTLTATQAGTYWVIVSNDCESIADTLEITVASGLSIDLGNDTVLCPGQTLALDATTPNVTYLWQDNSTSPTYTVSQTGTYWVRLTDNCGSVADTITVTYPTPLSVDLGNDTVICSGQSVLLDATAPNATYLWQDNSINPTLTATQAGTYWVIVSNDCESIADTVEITVASGLSIDLGNDTLLCPGQTLTLDATTPNVTYLWQDNSASATYTVNQADTYWVRITDNCGSVTDTITVGYETPLSVDLGNDTAICSGETVPLDATAPNATYLWQDNATGATFTATQAGIYWVVVSNACESITDTMEVSMASNISIDLGNDITLCAGETLTLDATTANVTYLWQDGSVAATYNVGQAGNYRVEITDGCVVYADSVEVTYHAAPAPLNIGGDTTICQGDVLTLNANRTDAASYLWSNNATDAVIDLGEAGKYWVAVTLTACGVVTDTIQVDIDPCSGCHVTIPNAFSPNSDGYNDVFRPIYNCNFAEYRLTIFNRWGEKLFESSKPGAYWDGTYKGENAEIDVYVYHLQYRFDGEESQNTSGNVTLIR